MTAMLAKRTVLLIGDGGEVDRQLASGLAAAGAAVGAIGPALQTSAMTHHCAGIRTSGADAAFVAATPGDRASLDHAIGGIVDLLGTPDLVILPITDPGGLSPMVFATMDETEFAARCEAPLKAMRVALQASHALLKGKGGRILLLVPTVAIVGVDGLAAYGAVAEGARSLAKAAARRWGEHGITVNCLALTADQLHPGVTRDGPATRTPQALGHAPDLVTEVAPFIAAFVSGPAIVTGTTIMVDGGNVMSV